MMQAIILAGGLGKRLRPITETIPKPMIEVSGKPFLEHLIIMLKKRGITDFLICSAHLGEQIEEYFGDGSALGVSIKHSIEPEPLGTGGALVYARELLEDEFFLINGDTYLDIDYADVEKEFASRGKNALMVVYTGSEIVEAVQNIEVGTENTITAYANEEKRGDGTFVDAGVSAFKKSVLELAPPEKKFSFEKEVVSQLIKKGEMTAYQTGTRYYDIGTEDRIKMFEHYMDELKK